jgi:hypothetical protein
VQAGGSLLSNMIAGDTDEHEILDWSGYGDVLECHKSI